MKPVIPILRKENAIFSSALITKLKSREESAFLEVYDAYSTPLFAFVSKILPTRRIAEQALQNTFQQAFERVDTFNEKRDDLYVWLLNIARNEAIELLINDQSKQLALLSTMMCRNSYQVNKFLVRLDPCEKAIFSLMYYRRFDYEQISKLLKLPALLVKGKIRSSYNKLAEIFPTQSTNNMQTKMQVA